MHSCQAPAGMCLQADAELGALTITDSRAAFNSNTRNSQRADCLPTLSGDMWGPAHSTAGGGGRPAVLGRWYLGSDRPWLHCQHLLPPAH